MPNFSARIVSGTIPTQWKDPRINPKVGHPPRYQKASIGTEICLGATPEGGSEGDADITLGGDLFTVDAIEYPTALAPVFTPDVGHSTFQRFTPATLGHYFVILRRANGGGIGFHFDVEP